ncbi:hypothetical protein JTE90_011130 [Oedothorax gibbosus]|uniref:protein-tyrosine-phosphatase n=1 Tax=Oedothorax gibbosus TaxID=931172 RepID=A0AAV6TH53_9ARAC|nr:hypothetical protein JTE90_011130 [Oedothorax gibbosus]
MATVWILLVACCFASVCRGDIDVDTEAPPGPSRELNVTELDHLVDTDEGRAELEAEFESIKGGQRKPWTVGEANLDKNRHADLLAYDETRVHLPYDEESDYINANYLDGFNREKEYVATQGKFFFFNIYRSCNLNS